MWASAPTKRRGLHQPPGPAAHSGASAARVRGNGRGSEQGSPQRNHQRWTIPQSACGCQLPLHKGALGTGDADCRVASLLAMTVLILCHSEEAQRADVGIRSFLRWTGVRAAESSAPTGGCGKPPATAGAALSEAESAERAAGQIQVLPDTLRAQHGVLCSEVSAKPRPCSRRGCVDWAGQFRAASRCARGRGASGLHNENASFLLTAPPPFSFWGAKKTTPAGVCRRQPPRSGGS